METHTYQGEAGMWELLADLVNILLGVLGLFQSKSSGAVCPYCRQNVRDDATACPHCGKQYV